VLMLPLGRLFYFVCYSAKRICDCFLWLSISSS